MVARKRGHEEMESAEPVPEPSLLDKLRNTWEFANLMQYIFIFGKAVKIDEDLDIEDLEQECCKPQPSTVLSDIGLALLKYVSSHRGLTPEIFDEYTRRQYLAKAPQRNPFGAEEEPKRFVEFDVFTKLKVLVQLSQWTLNNAERIREKLEERGESEQSVAWRINEIGYDRHDNYYFVLDDNRLYRRTEAPLPPSPPPAPKPKPKSTSKRGKAAARASKRRKTREAEESANDADIETPQPEMPQDEENDLENDDGFGGRTWECVAITLEQYRNFLDSVKKSRDPDEKALHKRISDDVMPIIEQAEASQLRKQQRRERELINMQKLATAKRSSRLEAKIERERQEREVLEAEQKRRADLAEAQAYQKRQHKMEEDRESRMMTREQRLKDRELKRILHEEDLARMSEEEKKVDAGEARLSERHLKAEIEKKKKELAALQQEDDWTFDCSKCGKHGTNWDDGTHSVACEKCNVWQHSACLGFSQIEAEKDDFHFVCRDCKRREEDAKKPKIPSLKFRVATSSSPPDQKSQVIIPTAQDAGRRKADGLKPQQQISRVPNHLGSSQQPTNNRAPRPPQSMQNGMNNIIINGPPLSSQGYFPHQTTSQQTINKSPPRVSNYINGYNRYPNQPNGYDHQPPNQSFQPPPFMVNGHQQGNQHHPPGTYSAYQSYRPPQPAFQSSQASHQHQQHAGWSARYVPPQHQLQSPSPHGPPPADLNPFANTLNDRRPPSSHRPPSSLDLNSAFSSPLQKAPALSPSQYQTQASSFNAHSPSTSATSQVNGFATNNITAHRPIGAAVQSPKKQASPPSAPPIHQFPPSSSPVAHQPALPANGLTSPGFSPVKHNSPQHVTPGYGITRGSPNSPPGVKLAPSMMQQQFAMPIESPIAKGPTQTQEPGKQSGQS